MSNERVAMAKDVEVPDRLVRERRAELAPDVMDGEELRPAGSGTVVSVVGELVLRGGVKSRELWRQDVRSRDDDLPRVPTLDPGDRWSPGTLRPPAVLNVHVSGHDVPIDDLLIHADFVRSLARDLVRDPTAADDLAQDAWVRALESPPRHGASLRGWLATLLRNTLQNRRRAERRRVARECIATDAQPVGVPSPEQILDRELVRERLVRAVLRLDEPFRAAVLLRYYEDLPAPAIARRLGVPAATVRTRLARGMQRLRAILDDDHGGHRPAWVAPLAAAWNRPRATLVAAAGTIAMKKILFALAALAVVLLSAALVLRGREDVSPDARQVGVVQQGRGGPGESGGTEPPAAAAQRAAATAAFDARQVRAMPADRGTGSIRGELIGARNLVEGVQVEASPTTGTLPPRMQLRDDREFVQRVQPDAGGAFRFDGVPAGPTRLRAVFTDGRVVEEIAIVARDAVAGPVLLRSERANGGVGSVVEVTVVDGDGHPVAGAETELFAWTALSAGGNRIEDPRREPLARAHTDGDGKVRWDGLAVRSGFVFARSASGVGRAAFDVDRSSFGLEIRLGAAVGLRGVLDGVDAAQLRGAVVTLHAIRREGIQWGGSRAFDAVVAGHEFVFAELPPGLYGVTLQAPCGVRLVVPTIGDGPDAIANSARMHVVGLERGVVESRFEVVNGPRLRGRVTTAGGAVAGARVRAVFAPRTSNDTAGFVLRGVHVWRFDNAWENCLPDPLTHVDVVTDADGRYELTSLQPGVHRVEVVANGLCYDRRMDVALVDGETVELVHELVPAGVLQVAALGLSYIGVSPAGSLEPTMIAIIPGQHVTFPGLRPGRWQILRLHSNSAVAPVVIAEADVVAGRTTWVDLRAATVAAVVHGVVTSGGVPVPRVGVGYYPAEASTDAFGSFRLELGNRVRLSSHMAGHPLRLNLGGVVQEWISGSDESAADVECAVEIGTRRLRVEIADEAGNPVAARLQLYGGAGATGTGIRNAAIVCEVPSRGAEFGPMWPMPLRGNVTFADGLNMPLEIPGDVSEWRVRRAVTVTLVATVRDGSGAALPNCRVAAQRWTGSDPAPDDPKLFTGTVESHNGLTGADGSVRLVVPPGDYVVYPYAFLSTGQSVRLRVDVGAAPAVELTMK